MVGISADISLAWPDFELDVRFSGGAGVTALYGPSGAGKTTIINAIAGLLTPDRGRIEIAGRPVYDSEARIAVAPERRHVGYVFQDHRLFPHLNVQQNLTYGFRKSSQVTEIEDVIDILNLGSLLLRRPGTLSGGERQRVAIGRAILAGPDVLLMDEPLASLDLARRHEVLGFIERLHSTFDFPVVYVSHNLGEVLRLADKVVVLSGGKVVAEGPAEAALSEASRGGSFTGADPGTVLTAVVTAHAPDDGLTTLSIPGGRLILPNIERDIGHSVRVLVRARDVAIATERPTGLSILNTLEATIQGLAIDPAGPFARVALSLAGGATLEARITRRSAIDLGLATGMTVWALVKSVALDPELALAEPD